MLIFICGNLFLRFAEKIANISKIKTHKNFLPHANFILIGFVKSCAPKSG